MSKSRNAIAVIKFGDNPMYRISLDSIKLYAEKYDLSLIVLDELLITQDSWQGCFCNEKFQLMNWFNRYDRILYLDLDILVNPDAPNIFDVYPSGTWALDESHLPWTQEDAAFFESKYDLQFPTVNGKKRMLNAGVQLLDKSIESVLRQYDPLTFTRSFENGTKGDEQTYWNMLLVKNQYPVNHLDSTWNSLIYPECLHLQPKVRKSRFFLHYAGRTYYPDHSNLIFEDSVNLWSRED